MLLDQLIPELFEHDRLFEVSLFREQLDDLAVDPQVSRPSPLRRCSRYARLCRQLPDQLADGFVHARRIEDAAAQHARANLPRVDDGQRSSGVVNRKAAALEIRANQLPV